MTNPAFPSPHARCVPTPAWLTQEPKLANAIFQIVEQVTSSPGRLKAYKQPAPRGLQPKQFWTVKVLQSRHPNYQPGHLISFAENELASKLTSIE